MPICCKSLHLGWICPRCGKRSLVHPHNGNDPVPIGKISQQVTVVHGDVIHGSVIQDSVVVGDVPSTEKGKDKVKDSIVIKEEIDTEFLDELL